MIWRLEYRNKSGLLARLDIQKGDATPVEIIEGTENPFFLSYELEGKNKKGFIMSSFADISIYETPTFNIDDLKTSNETELSVKWYINSILTWSGFVVPDFFSREIGEPAIVNLAASDRLSALKDSTLDGLAGYINMKALLEACLAKTGLALPLAYTVDFKTKINGSTIDFMYVVASAERLQDDKGKRISCYDILRSILVLSNSTIRQRNGSWRVFNKIQHEAVAPTLNFNEVYAGAKRTIQPVFSSVGAFQEFGGGDRYPKNYDFKVATGWTAKNGFVFARENREVLGYTYNEFDYQYTPILGDVTNNYQLFNENYFSHLSPTLATSPYLESSKELIPYDSTSIGIEVLLTATGPVRNVYGSRASVVNFAVIAESDTETLILNRDGAFVPISNKSENVQLVHFSRNDTDNTQKLTKSATFKGELRVDTNVEQFKLSIRIYGSSGPSQPTYIDSISYKFKSDEDIGKGMLYRTEQIGVFSKKNDPETTIFGDYISNGLNGYFYPYSTEDTSILRSPVDPELLSRLWTTATDPASGELPILQHVARQNSRMFGVAHNILSAVIDANTFDPLAIVTNCADEKYVVVAATFDFLRSTVEVELQQIAYGTLERRDFIYNYFGGADDGIRSIGAASSGGGTSIGGGGSFLDKYFTFDDENDALIANVNLVSEKEIAAYFDDGTLPSIFDNIPFATFSKVGGIKAASTFKDGIRINSLGFLEIDPSYADSGVSSWDDLANRPTWLTPTTKAAFESGHGHPWGQITGKPTSFPPSSHNHIIGDVTGLQTVLNGKLDTTVFNDLEIGGRNLLRDSEARSGGRWSPLAAQTTFTADVVDGNACQRVTFTESGGFSALSLYQYYNPTQVTDLLWAGRTLVASVQLRADVSANFTNLRLAIRWEEGGTQNHYTYSGAFSIVAGQWKTIHVKVPDFPFHPADKSSLVVYFVIDSSENWVGRTLWLRRNMLSFSTTPTDWTPAPEDKLDIDATAYDSARLGGHLASKYPKRDVAEVITKDWNFTGNITAQGEVTAQKGTLSSLDVSGDIKLGTALNALIKYDAVNDVIRFNKTIVSDYDVVAYADSGQVLPSIFDNLPKASTTNFGLVKIGSGISVTGGVISVDGDTFDFDNYYTKTNLQTSGQSSVHWGNLKSKPTTLGGYGITDALTSTAINSALNLKFDKAGGSISGNVSIGGNLTVLGTEFIANVQTVQIKDNLAVLNYGETGAGVTAGFAGWEIDRGTLENFRFGFSENLSVFQVGKPSSMQTVATRENVPISGGFAKWNSSLKRFDTQTLNIANWDTAFANNLRWDGGSTGLNAATGRASLGLTGVVGTHTHTYLHINFNTADNISGSVNDENLWSNGVSLTSVSGDNTTYPTGYGTLATFKSVGTRTLQLYGSHKGGRLFVRTPYSTDVENWYEVYTTGNLTNPIQGTGTAGYLPKFTDAATLAKSVIFETGGGISIGKTGITSGYTLDVNGAIIATGGNSTNWNTAYTDRFKWNGGSTGLDAATGRASLGLTNAVLGTGSAGKVAFWDSANGLTKSDDFLFDGATLRFANGGGGRGVHISNNGIRFKASGAGGWATQLSALDQSNDNIGNIVGGFGEANSFLYAYLGGTAYNNAALYAHPNNSVSINKTSVTSGYTLDVNGSIRASGNILGTGEVTAYTASDKRLKKNIKPLNNALEIVSKLNPVTYNWNAKAVELNGNKDITGVNYGLIAQEVEKIAPHLIRPIYGDFKTYDDRGLMTIMLQAIKELKSKVDKLENKN